MTRRSTLLVADDVRVRGIPKGILSRSIWQGPPIWTGSLKVIEEEIGASINEEALLEGMNYVPQQNFLKGNQNCLLKPHMTLRLKLEFYTNSHQLWAEVWYNPQDENSCFYIANDGQETIQICPDSCRHFKVIAQLPGTGYHPLQKNTNTNTNTNTNINDSPNASGIIENNSKLGNFQTTESHYIPNNGTTNDDYETMQTPVQLTQVALGIEFGDIEDSWQFLEALDRYHTRFTRIEKMHSLEKEQSEMVSGIYDLSLEESDVLGSGDDEITQAQTHHQQQPREGFNYDDDDDDNDDDDEDDDDYNDDDDDEFGEFVEA